MLNAAEKVAEIVRPTAEQFRNEIYPKGEPVVMRGVANDWPLVKAAARSDNDIASYLRSHDNGASVDILVGDPSIKGRFFYGEGCRGVNFKRAQQPLAEMLGSLANAQPGGDNAAVYVQATPVSRILPSLLSEVALPHAPPSVTPMIWIGNAVTVQTHFDLSQNIACVAGGRRRFTLFPPDQTANLYMGPIENTPSGTPISLVALHDVDFEKFPRFREAERHARVADLEPGDAIFIPYLWWHHVQSFDRLNVLVNYWWNEYDVLGSPLDTLLHAILTLRDQPPPMRDAWKAFFDHFVFGVNGSCVDHIPPDMRGGLGELSWPARVRLWNALAAGVRHRADLISNRKPD